MMETPKFWRVVENDTRNWGKGVPDAAKHLSGDRVVVPRFWVVGSEDTQFWREDIRNAAGRLMEVLLWDETRAVNLCSIVPCAEMWHVGHITHNQVSEEVEGEILLAEEEQVKYWEYGSAYSKVLYGGNVSLDEWEKRLEWHDGDEDAAYQELVDEAIEYIRCNGMYESELLSLAGWGEGKWPCEVVEDGAGFSGRPRLTCFTCNKTVVWQPYMSEAKWQAVSKQFRKEHGE